MVTRAMPQTKALVEPVNTKCRRASEIETCQLGDHASVLFQKEYAIFYYDIVHRS